MAKAPIPTPPAQFAVEVEAIRAALNDPSLTPEGRVFGMLAEVETFQAPIEREGALRDVMKQFAAFVREQRATIADQSTLVREAREFYKAAQALARPIPVLTPAQIVRNMFDTFQQLGWGSGAIELLMVDLKPDDLPLKTVDRAGVTTSARRIDLEELIIRHRPRGLIEKFFESWRKSNMRPDFMARSEQWQD